MAQGRLAQHVFRSRKSAFERGTRRRAEAVGACRFNHAGNGVAIYSEQSGCKHHHSRHAENPQCRGKHRGQRQRPAARRAARGLEETSLGAHPDRMEPVGMRYRKFGRTGWDVSEIGYGMWGMGGWSGSDDSESLDALQRAVDLGCNFFDTAWAYGEGHSEQ